MPKKREKNPEEYWKGKHREVTKENQHLKKRIRQLEKTEHMYEDVIMGEKEVEYEEFKLNRYCEYCGKGKLKEINILDRIFEECDTCDHRKKISGPTGG